MEITEKAATSSERVGSGLFTTSAVLQAVTPSFLSTQTCRSWVIGQLHRSGARCPSCNHPVSRRVLPRFLGNGRVKCSRCNKFFTALTGTFLAGTHMDFREIVFLAFSIEIGLPARVIAERMGVDADTVRLWRDKFRFIGKTAKL